MSAEDTAKSVGRSVVQVCAHEGNRLLEDLCGSGFLISSNLVITSTASLGTINGDPRPIVRIFPPAGAPPEDAVVLIGAQLLGASEETEVALLGLLEHVNYPPIRRGDATTVQPGDSLITIGHPWMSRGYGSWLITGGLAITPCFDEPGTVWSDLSFHEGSQGGPLLTMHGEAVGMVRLRDKTPLDTESCVPLPIAQPSWHRAPSDVMTRQVTFEPVTARPHVDMATINALVEGWLSASGNTMPENPTYPSVPQSDFWPTEALYSGRAPTQVWADLNEEELSAAQAVAEATQLATVAMVSGGQVGAAGVLIASDLVLTNYHVAWDERAGEPRDNSVALFDGTLIEAELIGDTGSTGMSGATDIALYRLAEPVDIAPLPVASEALMEEDATIITVGHPQLLWGYGFFTVMGGRYKRVLRDAMMMRIHTSPGNSGGPIVNTDGYVVGANSGCEPSLPSLMQPMAFLAGPAPVEVHDQILTWEDCQYQSAVPGSTIIRYLDEWGVRDQVVVVE